MSEPVMSKEAHAHESEQRVETAQEHRPTNDLDTALERKSFFQAALPVFACGAGLFSDGYINNVRIDLVPSAAAMRLLTPSRLCSGYRLRKHDLKQTVWKDLLRVYAIQGGSECRLCWHCRRPARIWFPL